MMIVIITVATIVGMMSIAVMRMTMEKDIYWDHNHRVLRLHLLNISVIGGWDGRKALNSVEFYNEQKREWEESRRTRLAQERRWAAATQISHKLFSYCVQKRSWSFSHTHRAQQHPNIPENFFQENKSTQNIRNCDSKETHWKLRLLYCETCTEVGDPW